MNDLIFLSYRRLDSENFTLRLSEHLRSSVYAEVFVDSQAIRGGRRDWQDQIGEALGRCTALIVVVGPNWAYASRDGRPCLEREDDWVRTEIRTALHRQIPIYVVRVGDSQVPAQDVLPTDIANLSRKQTVSLRPANLVTDLAQLLDWMTSDGCVRRRWYAQAGWRRYLPVVVAVALATAAAVSTRVCGTPTPSGIVVASLLDEIDLSHTPYPPVPDPYATVTRRFTVRIAQPPSGQEYMDISNTGGAGIDCLGPSTPQDFVPIDAQQTQPTSARARHECRFTASPAALQEARQRPLQYGVVYHDAFRSLDDRWLVKRFAYETRLYSLRLRFRNDRRPIRIKLSAGREGEPRRELGVYPVDGSEFLWSHQHLRQGEWIRIEYE